MRANLGEAVRGLFADAEMRAVRPVLDVQARWSRVPAADEVLAERIQTRDGHHLFFYPPEGRLVHEGVAALLAYRLSRRRPQTFTLACNGYGFELASPDPLHLDAGALKDLLEPAGHPADVLASLNAAAQADAVPALGRADARIGVVGNARRPRAQNGRGAGAESRTGMIAQVEIAGERLLLRPDRSLFWPRAKALVIADPRFGKAETFRAAGVPVPGDSAEPLARLGAALGATAAEQLFVLGDFWHAQAGRRLSPRVVSLTSASRSAANRHDPSTRHDTTS